MKFSVYLNEDRVYDNKTNNTSPNINSTIRNTRLKY